MATMQPENLQPLCEVTGCKEGAQMLSINGTTATWMKTCCQHNYQFFKEEQEQIETFWPPVNK